MQRTALARRWALTGALLISGCLLIAACGSSVSSSSDTSNSAGAAHGAAGFGAAANKALNTQGGPSVIQVPAATGQAGEHAIQTAKLAPADQSIIYTASLTVQAANVAAAAQRAVSLVAAVGGYIADEQKNLTNTGQTGRTVNLTLKIPVPAYQEVLGQLSSPAIGKQLSMEQQATDVTAQVADVNSLVTSEQSAITALQGLLRHAASVSGLLEVQQQISNDESTLNSLLAQQRALDHETTYGTVTMTLVSPAHAVHHKPKPVSRHNFLTGLAAGWRTLRHATAWVLTAFGAALPFLVVVVVLAGSGYAGWRRVMRRRPGPTATRPTAAGPTTVD